ncbi:PTS transporter subunit EIIC [Enterobacter quasihormaechei]|uniref:PTS transporter subunit EIIC n=1 Tax=Enterobacter quasihormaechei TaxID=2529382 RepID=UPI002F4275E9
MAILGVTGRYQAGFYPIIVFGLPEAALAIYRCSYSENKGGTENYVGRCVCIFFIGITESLELSFMFLVHVLYFGHAQLSGLFAYIIYFLFRL